MGGTIDPFLLPRKLSTLFHAPRSRLPVCLRISNQTLANFCCLQLGDLISKQCAVCTDNFEVSQEVVALPCAHSYHTDCILPWLKMNGTCPVCRHQLVPQPQPHGGPVDTAATPTGNIPEPRNTSRSSSEGHPRERSRTRRQPHLPGAWDELD